MVDVGYRLAYDLKELSHKAQAVSSIVEQRVVIGRCLGLILG